MQTYGSGVAHKRREDPFCTGYRDGQCDAWAALPYRPPLANGKKTHWGVVYGVGYAQGYAQGAGLDVKDLHPEERRAVGLNHLLRLNNPIAEDKAVQDAI